MEPDNVFYIEEAIYTNVADNEMNIAIIPAAVFIRLIERDNKLRKLEDAGVDNWEGYDDAVAEPKVFEGEIN